MSNVQLASNIAGVMVSFLIAIGFRVFPKQSKPESPLKDSMAKAENILE